MYVPPPKEPIVQSEIPQERTEINSSELPSTGTTSEASKSVPKWNSKKQTITEHVNRVLGLPKGSAIGLGFPILYPVTASLAYIGDRMIDPVKKEGLKHAIGTLLLAPHKGLLSRSSFKIGETTSLDAHRNIEKLKKLNRGAADKANSKEIKQFFNELHVTYEKARKTGDFTDLKQKLNKLEGPSVNNSMGRKINTSFNRLLENVHEQQIITEIAKAEQALGMPKGMLHEKYLDARSDRKLIEEYQKEVKEHVALYNIPYQDQLRLKENILKELFPKGIEKENEVDSIVHTIMDLEHKKKFPQGSEEGKWKQARNDILSIYIKYHTRVDRETLEGIVDQQMNKRKKADLENIIDIYRRNNIVEVTPEEGKKNWNELCKAVSQEVLGENVFDEQYRPGIDVHALSYDIAQLAVTLCSMEEKEQQSTPEIEVTVDQHVSTSLEGSSGIDLNLQATKEAQSVSRKERRLFRKRIPKEIRTEIFKAEEALGIPKGTLCYKYLDANGDRILKNKYYEQFGEHLDMYSIPYQDQVQLKKEILKGLFSQVVEEIKTEDLVNTIMDLENKKKFPEGSEEEKWKRVKENMISVYGQYHTRLDPEMVEGMVGQNLNNRSKVALNDFVKTYRDNSVDRTPEERKKAWNDLCIACSQRLLGVNVFDEQYKGEYPGIKKPHIDVHVLRHSIAELAVTLYGIEEKSS